MIKKKYIEYQFFNNELKKCNINYPKKIEDNEILFKIKYCGVCGSDINMINNGSKRIKNGSILGHEIVAKIVEKGINVKKQNINDTYAIGADILNNCKNYNKNGINCYYCRQGMGNLCLNPRALGHEINGGFSDYLLISKEVFENTPNNKINSNIKVSPIIALCEPLACCINSFDKVNDLNKKSVMIYGFGPMGYLLGKYALYLGYTNIIYIEINKSRISSFKKLNESKMEIYKTIKEVPLHKFTIQQIFIACKSLEAIKQSLELNLKNFQINFFSGLKSNKTLKLTADLIHYNQITISGSHGSTISNFKKAYKLINNNKIKINTKFYKIINMKNFIINLSSIKKGKYLKVILEND